MAGDGPEDGWVEEVLKFWFEQTEPHLWFKEDPTLDATIQDRFLDLHENLVARGNNGLLTDAQTPLAAVIVLDQMSRNMFRDTPRTFEADPQALQLAEAAITQDLTPASPKTSVCFCIFPSSIQRIAKCKLPELQKWAEAHKAIVDRFGRFPHRNAILGRISTPEEIEFLKQPDSCL